MYICATQSSSRIRISRDSSVESEFTLAELIDTYIVRNRYQKRFSRPFPLSRRSVDAFSMRCFGIFVLRQIRRHGHKKKLLIIRYSFAYIVKIYNILCKVGCYGRLRLLNGGTIVGGVKTVKMTKGGKNASSYSGLSLYNNACEITHRYIVASQMTTNIYTRRHLYNIITHFHCEFYRLLRRHQTKIAGLLPPALVHIYTTFFFFTIIRTLCTARYINIFHGIIVYTRRRQACFSSRSFDSNISSAVVTTKRNLS